MGTPRLHHRAQLAEEEADSGDRNLQEDRAHDVRGHVGTRTYNVWPRWHRNRRRLLRGLLNPGGFPTGSRRYGRTCKGDR